MHTVGLGPNVLVCYRNPQIGEEALSGVCEEEGGRLAISHHHLEPSSVLIRAADASRLGDINALRGMIDAVHHCGLKIVTYMRPCCYTPELEKNKILFETISLQDSDLYERLMDLLHQTLEASMVPKAGTEAPLARVVVLDADPHTGVQICYHSYQSERRMAGLCYEQGGAFTVHHYHPQPSEVLEAAIEASQMNDIEGLCKIMDAVHHCGLTITTYMRPHYGTERDRVLLERMTEQDAKLHERLMNLLQETAMRSRTTPEPPVLAL